MYILWRICPMQELLSHRNLERHATVEERVFAARCWVTHATVERVAAPRPASFVATQREGKHISSAVSRHATIADA
jgi:hypothetical protein